MSVYDRSYRNYEATLTPAWSRFLVPARYALQDAFSSRLFLSFFFLCLAWPLVCAVILYLRYNTEALAVLNLSIADLFKVDALTFRDYFMDPQGALAFVVVLILGPALVSSDLRNNALPLYLARPLTKVDYILGKLAVLALVLSAITWIPGWLLFFFQAYLEGGGWLLENVRALVGMFLGFWIWILVLSLFCLALSAWVKWKPLARILFLGAVFVSSGMGEAFNAVYGSWKGSLLVLDSLRDAVWDQLFGIYTQGGLPAWAAWLALLMLCALSVLVLSRRIRAYEVVS